MKKLGKSFICFMLAFMMIMTLCLNTTSVNAATKKAKLTPKTVSLTVGQSKTMKLSNKPKKAKITWTISNKKVATVTKKGKVTAKKPGSTTLKVKVKKGKKSYTLQAKIKVKAKYIYATNVTVASADVTLNEGENSQIQASVAPSNATNKTLTYTSSDTDVAVVDEKGVITAKAEGTSTVTIATTNGKKATVNVTVTKKTRPRAIFTNDAECDDMNSAIHFLLYANEIDIKGLVQTSSTLHWKGGDSTEQDSAGNKYSEPYRWPGTNWAYDYVEAYAKCYSNLKANDPTYPSPNYLRSITKVGNIDYPNEMSKDTEGSNLIKKEILKDDSRTLYLLAGGGTNSIARALKSIEDEYKNTAKWASIYKHVTETCVLSICFQQDGTYKSYICEHWPDIRVVDISGQMGPTAYTWKLELAGEAAKTHSSAYMQKNIVKNHGALLDYYFTWGDGKNMVGETEDNQFGTNSNLLESTDWWGGNIMGQKLTYSRYDFLSEGDSATFYILVDSGLRTSDTADSATLGGYGGRYVLDTTQKNSAGIQLPYYVNANDYYEEAGKFSSSHSRWEADIMHEMAVRADWCIKGYDACNHEPSVSVTEGTSITAKAGEKINLHAIASDPDGDYVSYQWFEYFEADTYPEADDATSGSITLKGAESDVLTFTVPEDAKSGDTIHMVVKATDDGEFNLTHYARVIITVK